MECSVVVPAAGSGSRFGGEVPKQFVLLAGRPLIAHTLLRLERNDAVVQVVVAATADQFARLESICERETLTKCRLVEGGATRAESVLRGLTSLSDASDDSFVAVHDAVRPFVSAELLGRLLAALVTNDGVFPGLPPTDTIHVIENGQVAETFLRERLASAQTPQCFRLGVVRRALEEAVRAGLSATDEVSAVVRLGLRVAMVEGEPNNFKVTRPEDLERAERLLARKEV
jgi:2-C-methyl-D-erythritol 4-phosphate cytidylyltransferase